MPAFFSTQNRTEHFYFKQKHENVYNIVQRIYICTSFFYNNLATLFSGETVQDPPKPRVSPFTTSTEEEINKQINRELFAHYTYLSMVSFYKAFRGYFLLHRVSVFLSSRAQRFYYVLIILYCFSLGIQAMHFDRDDIDLPGFHKFFKESSEEELKHAHMVSS